MDPETCYNLFKRLKERNPQPTTELVFSSTFELLVAVILSAQATDTSVNKATKILFNVANTPEKIVALGLESLKSYVKSIGLYNTKAANIIKTSEILIHQYNSNVPKDRKSLESLPGVGRKTANVILNTAFGEPTIAVDTHIFRVANRTKMAIGKTPLEVERKLVQIIPDEFIHEAHHWLVLHGRYVCTAIKPKCPICPIRDFCEYENKVIA